uniref:Uncharacterized protein n=1 Tax=Glossina austeni TaxID=7395 RepID=A0A1A9UN71_GLOAU
MPYVKDYQGYQDTHRGSVCSYDIPSALRAESSSRNVLVHFVRPLALLEATRPAVEKEESKSAGLDVDSEAVKLERYGTYEFTFHLWANSVPMCLVEMISNVTLSGLLLPDRKPRSIGAADKATTAALIQTYPYGAFYCLPYQFEKFLGVIILIIIMTGSAMIVVMMMMLMLMRMRVLLMRADGLTARFLMAFSVDATTGFIIKTTFN